jgi:hypothetical protein
VAFEDPDSSKLKSLLAGRHLFAFGTRATLRKWKQRTKRKTEDSPQPTESEDEETDVQILLSRIVNSPVRPVAPSTTIKHPTANNAPSTQKNEDKFPGQPNTRARVAARKGCSTK